MYFDIVLSKDVIEHARYYDSILAELSRLTKRWLILSMFIKMHDQPDLNSVSNHRGSTTIDTRDRSFIHSWPTVVWQTSKLSFNLLKMRCWYSKRDPLSQQSIRLHREVIFGVVKAYVLDHFAQQSHIGWQKPCLDIGAEDVAQDSAEILVPRV